MTVPRKIVTVHFTTIPCEPNTARPRRFREIEHCTNSTVYGRWGVARPFLYVFTGILGLYRVLRIRGESTSRYPFSKQSIEFYGTFLK